MKALNARPILTVVIVLLATLTLCRIAGMHAALTASGLSVATPYAAAVIDSMGFAESVPTLGLTCGIDASGAWCDRIENAAQADARQYTVQEREAGGIVRTRVTLY